MANSILRRYTSVSDVLHILHTHTLTLRNPWNWDDKNDVVFLDAYKNLRKLGSLQALCFSRSSETYHHWRVFTSGSDGACIEFNEPAFAERLENLHGYKFGDVRYWKINDLKKSSPPVEDLPFIKRHPYRDELEARLIFESRLDNCALSAISIDLKVIRKIILSPWLPEAVFLSLREIIRLLAEGQVQVARTTLLLNEQWSQIAASRVAEAEAMEYCYFSVEPPPGAGAPFMARVDRRGIVMSTRNGDWAPEARLTEADLRFPEQCFIEWDIRPIKPGELGKIRS